MTSLLNSNIPEGNPRFPALDPWPEARRKKPHAEVTVDSVTLPIWRTRWRDQRRRKTYISYTFAWRDASGRHREKRNTLESAKRRAETVATSIANGTAYLTQAQAATFRRVQELLAPTGTAPELAAGIYTESVQILGGRSLIEAARYYAATHPVGFTMPNAATLVEDFFAKRAMCAKWKRILQHRLDKFAAHFTGALTDLRARELDDWLDGLKDKHGRKIRPVTRNGYRSAVEALANFAKDRGYLARDWAVLEAVPVTKEPVVKVDLYTPEELVRLLNKAETYAAGRKLVPLIAITSFAGVRHGEMNEEKTEHLDWSNIDWEARTIYIGNEESKTGRDRVVDMPDNLIAWLLPYRRPRGKICELANTSNALCRLRARAHIAGRKKNSLRKSFISYKVALTRNEAEVADQAGNSVSVIRRHYKRSDTSLRADAARWFNIFPTRADVLPLFQWANRT